MKTSIVLLCMTKNGRQKLPTLLGSVKGLVDQAIILDTGSTDGTVQWLQETDSWYPLVVQQSKFVDFGTSRTELFKFANDVTRQKRGAVWYLLLDDDMVLEQEKTGGFEKLREELSNNPIYDGLLLKHIGAPEYWVTRLIRGELEWTFKGVTHEYLYPLRQFGRAEQIGILHNAAFSPEKFERDLRMLSADIARDPNDPRTIFYLAQTLRDKGEREAAGRFYVMRSQMGGWQEEIYISMLEAARIMKDPALMEKAHNFRPSRAEAAAWLANYYKAQGFGVMADKWEQTRSKIAFPKDSLFVHPAAYGPENKYS